VNLQKITEVEAVGGMANELLALTIAWGEKEKNNPNFAPMMMAAFGMVICDIAKIDPRFGIGIQRLLSSRIGAA
jgi:hypothetical protein